LQLGSGAVCSLRLKNMWRSCLVCATERLVNNISLTAGSGAVRSLRPNDHEACISFTAVPVVRKHLRLACPSRVAANSQELAAPEYAVKHRVWCRPGGVSSLRAQSPLCQQRALISDKIRARSCERHRFASATQKWCVQSRATGHGSERPFALSSQCGLRSVHLCTLTPVWVEVRPYGWH